MMEAYNHHGLEVDVNRMFDQYLYKGLEDSIDVSLSVPQYNSPQTLLHPQQQQQQQQQQHHQPQAVNGGGGLTNGGGHHSYDMNDQTFHTSSYGEDDFDISGLNPAAPQATQQQQQQQQSQISHAHLGHAQQQQHQQQNTYQMHHYNQWHPEQQQQHMTHSQNYQMPPQQQQQATGPHNYGGMTSPGHQQQQQMLMMQPPPQQSPQMKPQMSPQISNHSNFMGRSPPQQQQQQHQQSALGGVIPPVGQQVPGGPGGSDDSDDNGLINPLKRQSPDLSGDSTSSPPGGGNSNAIVAGGYMKSGPASGASAVGPANKKPKVQKKKKKRDPNEPQKPVSAYALFFRDTQAAIKGQNPNASFGEVSKIVASMWDVLATEHKNVYKKKTEAAKKEYLKALAAYRASLVSKGSDSESPQSIYTSPTPGQMQSPTVQQPPQSQSHSQSPGQLQQQQLHPQHPIAPSHTPPGGGGVGAMNTNPHLAAMGHQQRTIQSSQQGSVQQQQQQQHPHRQQYHHHLPMGHGQVEATSPGYPPSYKSPQQSHHNQMMSTMNLPHHPMHLSQIQHMHLSQMQMQHPQHVTDAQMPHYLNSQPLSTATTGSTVGHQMLATSSVAPSGMGLSGGGGQQQQQHMQSLSSGGSGTEGSQGMTGGGGGGGQQSLVMNGGGTGGSNNNSSQPTSGQTAAPSMCIRDGCPNQAVASLDWEDEYCSNECVITHCRDVFGNWVQQNNNGQPASVYPSVVK